MILLVFRNVAAVDDICNSKLRIGRLRSFQSLPLTSKTGHDSPNSKGIREEERERKK